MRAAALLALVVAAAPAVAQEYPARPIRIVVPFPAGGTPDLLARIIGQKLNEAWGQPVVVDNRPGAAGNIATDVVAKAAPDGYTILMGSSSPLTINPNLYAKLPYDIGRDLAAVTQVATVPLVLVVHPAVPAKSVKDLIGLAKAKPGQLNYASVGAGTPHHLGMELFKGMAGVDIVHVPYKGSGPALAELMGGQVQLMFDGIPAVLTPFKAGKVRALAVSSATRSPVMRDVPTVAEAGVPGFEVGAWYGVVVPAATPKPVVHKLGIEIAKVLRMPDAAEQLTVHGLRAVGNTPEQFAVIIKSETAKWAKIIKQAGIKID